MAASLNTAKALLDAGNFDSARQIAEELLEELPSFSPFWSFRIQIEMQAENYKAALKITHEALAILPDDYDIRECEFWALLRLKKKKEAAKVYQDYKRDFPHLEKHHKAMSFALNAIKGKASEARKSLNKLIGEPKTPLLKRNFGIALYKVDDAFRAQSLMEQAQPDLPDDVELNTALAINSFLLVRPSKCRKYASQAFALSFNKAHLRFVYWASFLLYLPPVFFMVGVFLVFSVIRAYSAASFAMLFLIVTMFYAADIIQIWSQLISRATGLQFLDNTTAWYVLASAITIVAASPKILTSLFPSQKAIRLKNY